MVDVVEKVRSFLAANGALVAVVGTRIYGGRDVPPQGYKPSDGACVTFRVRGGLGDYEDALLKPSVQVKCYGETEAEAGAVYRAVDRALHEGRGQYVLFGEREVLGQALEEPQTGWRYVLGFYLVAVRNS